jgi:uncharacterized protein YbjT (DUF2867 family)
MSPHRTVAVVGGHGQIARLLHPLLLEAGHTPVALVRSQEQADRLEAEGVRTRRLDLEADDVDAYAQAFDGCDRFVQVSAIDVDEPVPDDTDPVWRAYVEAKRDADAHLRGSALDWTIIRPGRLTDEAPTGSVALGEAVPRGEVTRADVAAVLLAVLEDDRTVGRQWNLVGGDTPVLQAVEEALGRD